MYARRSADLGTSDRTEEPATSSAAADARLLVVAPYPLRTVPGQRYRFEQYLDAWRDAGIEVEIRPMMTAEEMAILYRPGHVGAKVRLVLRGLVQRARDLAAARRFDAVYLYREAFPMGYPLFERLLALLGVPYVMDFDDAIWLPNAADANAFVARLKLSRLKTAVTARHATVVTTGNDHLAAWARQQGAKDVVVIPSTIDMALYSPAEPVRDRSPLCIGWTGSTTTVQHLRTIEPVLRDLHRERGIRLRVIGEPAYRLDGVDVEVLPWREATEVDDLRDIDIGIMPLPDDEWTKGKCGMKGLQYMALGIPTVLASVGANLAIAEGGATRLAGSPAEWRAVLEELLDDVEARRELGAAGRRRVEERYSVAANRAAYVDVVRRAAASRKAA